MTTTSTTPETTTTDRLAAPPVVQPVEVPCPPGLRLGGLSAAALRNVRMLHLLERIAAAFNAAGVPLMALKGAALNVTVHDHPGDRPMVDLDLLVKPQDTDRARAVLEEVGCLRSDIVFREDFFPRYYYEIEYTAGAVDPVLIDLHARPFRLLRYARLMPDEALWDRAVPVRLGRATVLVPSAEDMLIHLTVHSAIHGNGRRLWLEDLKRWVKAHRGAIEWRRFLDHVRTWRLALPVRSGLGAAEVALGRFVPAPVRRALRKMPDTWRDRLALWHAPRDGNLVASFLVSVLTTPGWRFVLGYVRDVLVPDGAYMDEWRTRHDCAHPRWARVIRCLAPVLRRLPRWDRLNKRVKVDDSGIHGLGVFARRAFKPGEVIARYRGRPVERDGTYVAWHTDATGRRARHEITGPLRFLNHSCHPRAELRNFRVVALRAISANQEITIDYGDDACTCRQEVQEQRHER